MLLSQYTYLIAWIWCGTSECITIYIHPYMNLRDNEIMRTFTCDCSDLIPSQIRYYPSTDEETLKNMVKWATWINKVLISQPQQHKAVSMLVVYHIEAETKWPTFRWRHIQMHFLFNENIWISINTSPNFVPKEQINNMFCFLVDVKPLFQPMIVSLLTHICATRPQWDMPSLMITIVYSRCFVNDW